MFRKQMLASMGVMVLALGAGVVRAESKGEIDLAATETVSKFTAANPAHAELLSKAVGVLIFPRITKAGVGIGGEHGAGVLRREGKTAHYYSVNSASVGLTLGAGERSEIILFMTRDSLAKFEHSNGYNLGVDAQVAVVAQGAGGGYDSETLKQPILGFIFNEKGLIGDISLKGSKIKRIAPNP